LLIGNINKKESNNCSLCLLILEVIQVENVNVFEDSFEKLSKITREKIIDN